MRLKAIILGTVVSTLFWAYASIPQEKKQDYQRRFSEISKLGDPGGERAPLDVIKADNLAEILKRDLERDGFNNFLDYVRKYDNDYHDQEVGSTLHGLMDIIRDNIHSDPGFADKYLSFVEAVVHGQITIDEGFDGREELRRRADDMRIILTNAYRYKARRGLENRLEGRIEVPERISDNTLEANTIRGILDMCTPDYVIYCDKATNLTKLYCIDIGSYRVVAQFRHTDGRYQGKKTRNGDGRTPEGIFKIRHMASSKDGNLNRNPYYDTARLLLDFPNPVDRDRGITANNAGMLICDDGGISERIRAIESSRDITNEAIVLKGNDMLRLYNTIRGSSAIVVIQDPSSPVDVQRYISYLSSL